MLRQKPSAPSALDLFRLIAELEERPTWPEAATLDSEGRRWNRGHRPSERGHYPWEDPAWD